MTIWIDRPAWRRAAPLVPPDLGHLVCRGARSRRRTAYRAEGVRGIITASPSRRMPLWSPPAPGPPRARNILGCSPDPAAPAQNAGEKGIARALDIVFPDGSIADIDMVASSMGPPEAADVRVEAVLIRGAGGRYLVGFSRRRQEWSAPGGWRGAGETPVETAWCGRPGGDRHRARSGTLRPVGSRTPPPSRGQPWPVPEPLPRGVPVSFASRAPTLTAPDGSRPSGWRPRMLVATPTRGGGRWSATARAP